MRVIGVDPGQTGALCLLGPDEFVVWDMPVVAGQVNAWALSAMLTGWGKVDRVAVEQVHSMPRQGVASSFKFGRSVGMIEGVLAVLERPVVYVTPNTWTKHHRLTSDKEGHRRRAMELWPEHADLFGRRKDDGRADAALIAEWTRSVIRPVIVGGSAEEVARHAI